MCHPGFADANLASLDPVRREEEFFAIKQAGCRSVFGRNGAPTRFGPRSGQRFAREQSSMDRRGATPLWRLPLRGDAWVLGRWACARRVDAAGRLQSLGRPALRDCHRNGRIVATPSNHNISCWRAAKRSGIRALCRFGLDYGRAQLRYLRRGAACRSRDPSAVSASHLVAGSGDLLIPLHALRRLRRSNLSVAIEAGCGRSRNLGPLRS